MYLYIFEDGKIAKTPDKPGKLDFQACDWGHARIINMTTYEEYYNKRWNALVNLEDIL